MTSRTLFAFALLAAAPVQAQQVAPPPVEEGLSGAVSDDSEWQDLGIAIPAFAPNADAPPATSAG